MLGLLLCLSPLSSLNPWPSHRYARHLRYPYLLPALKVVRWLLFHRREGGTAAAFEAAATNGRVHVLEWLMTHTALRPELRGDSPLFPSALARAAANGHLGVIR